MKKLFIFTLAVALQTLPLHAHAQKVQISDDPETVEVTPSSGTPQRAAPERTYERPVVGKKAAQKYFNKDTAESSEAHSSGAVGSDDHYLMLGLGAFVSSDNYKWGNKDAKNPGQINLDVTYRFGEWVNSMDFLVRIDYSVFDLDAGKKPKKLSFVPMITFPDAGSHFPLYFGVGAGLGVFFSQLEKESSISFDYQLALGVRFFNVFDSMGFYAETGMKNHILLLSSGQFNGFYVNIGTVHTF